MSEVTIQPLNNIAISSLVQLFNASFADYVVKVQMTEEALQEKIQADNIQISLSIGAKVGEQWVGFMLFASEEQEDKMIAYNAATGIVPDYRGMQLPDKMFTAAKALFKEQEIKGCVLEVITSNTRAVKAYERLGFSIQRGLACHKGVPKAREHSYTIHQTQDISSINTQAFWDHLPTWQNSNNSIARAAANTTIYVQQGEDVVGYAVYNKQSGRLRQLGVLKQYRQKGIGSALLQHIHQDCGKELTIINVDKRDERTTTWLTEMGLTNFIEQYEMYIKLD